MVSHKSERKKRKIFLRPIYWLLLVLFLNIQYVKAEAKIEIATTEFKEAPQSLFYFRESDVILYLESESNNVYRSDNEGKTWNLLKDISKKEITTIYRHPYDNDKAIIATSGKEHYLTQDQGKTWKSFEAPVLPASKSSTFLFNSKKPEYIIYLGSKCEHSGFLGSVETCKDSAYYTTNFFKSSPKKLLDNISTCKWVLSSEGKEMEDIDEKMVVCIKASDKKAPDAKEAIDASKLVWSTDFFNTKNLVDFDFDGVPDGGVIGFTVLQSFMVAAVRRDVGSEKLSLFVSKDAKVWAEGYLPKHKSLEQNVSILI
ncbi:hypothetical protein K502DRAFT_313437 [Neoconidiobolus thromboides FSU 785]|nr:hypothetical protein K502DRAFT_313437 [Neoconidiobolus thromboides FSU 785]